MTKEEKRTMRNYAGGAWLVWGWLIQSTDNQTTVKIEKTKLASKNEYDRNFACFFAKDAYMNLLDLAMNDYQVGKKELGFEKISKALFDMTVVFEWLENTYDNETVLSVSREIAPDNDLIGDYSFGDIEGIASDVAAGLLDFARKQKNNSSNDKIFRCPFCGGEAELKCETDWYIQCKRTETCGVVATFTKYGQPASDVDSIEAWNRRIRGNGMNNLYSTVSFFPDEAAKLNQMLRQKKANLKFCPFCGSRKLRLGEITEPSIGTDFLSIQCARCFTIVYFLSADTKETKTDIIDRWNRRTNS